jgi:hypothetical protein
LGSQNSQICISIKRKLFVDVVVADVVDVVVAVDAVVADDFVIAVVADVFVIAVVVVCVDVADVVAVDDDDAANHDIVCNWSLL